MTIDLSCLLIALSHALDFMEIDLLGGVTNHSKRVAYIALRIAEKLGGDREALADLLALAILHDNGIGVAFQDSSSEQGTRSKAESGPAHCKAGQENLRGYPFFTDTSTVLVYHHERWDGRGFFHIAGDAIPWMARLIRLADAIELHSSLDSLDYTGKTSLYSWLAAERGHSFDPDLTDAFLDVSRLPSFWLDLNGEFVNEALLEHSPKQILDFSCSSVSQLTGIFSRIIDSKSRFTRLHSQELSQRTARMARRFGFDAETSSKLEIAANLHDVGKLAVSNSILDKPGKLDPPEIDVIQRHTYYTRVSLRSMDDFEDITEWAANHHEKLDGSGYPFGLKAERLDFNSRLLGCLDIYQALTELRPYRKALEHETAVSIMREMAQQGKIEGAIVEEIDAEFAGSTATA